MTLNFIGFLWSGKYVTLVERLTGSIVEDLRKNRRRAVAFEYMNREIVWQGLTEFLLFVTPLISFEKVKVI